MSLVAARCPVFRYLRAMDDLLIFADLQLLRPTKCKMFHFHLLCFPPPQHAKCLISILSDSSLCSSMKCCISSSSSLDFCLLSLSLSFTDFIQNAAFWALLSAWDGGASASTSVGHFSSEQSMLSCGSVIALKVFFNATAL